jgi:hypothetical protein
MKSFTNIFEVTFNPQSGFVSHKEGRVTIDISLENVHSVQKAKEVLADKGIHASSIKRLD